MKHSNKNKTYRPLIYVGIFAVFAMLLVSVLSQWEHFTNELYPSLYKLFYPFYTHVFGWIPFSIGDVFYSVLILLLVWVVVLSVRCFFLGQKWRGIRVISRYITWATIFYLIFNFFWAFNYYKPTLREQYKIEEYSTEELKPIVEDLFSKCVTQRRLVKEDKNGVFDFKRKEFYSALNKELKHPKGIDLYYTKIPRKSFKKYSLFSIFMRYFGVSGYYNPFTGEAQITRLTPDTSIPFTMAHEQAHQMGYAPEFEANFIGFLSCVQSDSEALKYSANYKALKYALREIYSQDSTYVIHKLDSFSEGMKRDYEAEKIFRKKYSGVADEAFSAMNNAYLKANQQKDGVQSYNRFVELLVGYYRNK